MNGVKQHFDHSLRAIGKRFLSRLKASNRYSEGYLASLETTLGMAALYAEEQGWPDVQEITTEHIEDYLSYLQDRERWFGERSYAEPRKLSKGHMNAQYRRLNRFFNWWWSQTYRRESARRYRATQPGRENCSHCHGRPDEGPADPCRSRPRQNSRPPLPVDSRPGSAVRILGYSRSAERNRQAATPKHRPD